MSVGMSCVNQSARITPCPFCTTTTMRAASGMAATRNDNSIAAEATRSFRRRPRDSDDTRMSKVSWGWRSGGASTMAMSRPLERAIERGHERTGGDVHEDGEDEQ